MKTINSSSVKANAKKAITLGLAAMMIVSCGKSKNKVDENAVATPFTTGLAPGQICPAGTVVRRVFDYASSGSLTVAALRGGAVYATYLGHDPTTGDTATIRDYGNNSMQLDLNIKCTGDTNIDTTLLNNVPTIIQGFSGDLNVPNKQACPGRINVGTVRYGAVYSPQYGNVPVDSSFQPPQQCL